MKQALYFSLDNEGAFTKDGGYWRDAFGPVRCGVEVRDLERMKMLGISGWDIDGDGEITEEDIKDMTPLKAAHVFAELYWRLPLYTKNGIAYGIFSIQDSHLAMRVFDQSLPSGRQTVVRALQRACRATAWKVADDGIFASETLSAVNASPPNVLHAAFQMACEMNYRLIVAHNPSKQQYLSGWQNRLFARIPAEPLSGILDSL